MEKLLNLIMNSVKKEDSSKKVLTKQIIEIIKNTPNDQELGEKLRGIYIESKQNKK